MFLAVPCGILVLCALVVPIQDRLRKNVGFSWLFVTIAAGLIWAWTIYGFWLSNRELTLLPTVTVGSYPIKFLFDRSTAALFIGISSIYLTTMVTMVAQFEVDRGVVEFIALPAVMFVAFLSAAANDVWVLVLSWTVYDLAAGAFFLTGERKRGFDRKTVAMMALNLFSTFLLAVGFEIQVRSVWRADAAAGASYFSPLLKILAAGVRSGVLPPHQNGRTVPDHTAKAEMLVRLIGLIIAFPVYLRMEPAAFPASVLLPLRILAAAALLIGCGGWILSNRSVVGMNFFLIYCAALPFVSALRSDAQAVLMFSVTLPIAAVAIFYHAANYRIVQAILIGFLALFSGFPFTPLAGAWARILDESVSVFNIGLGLAQCLMIVGYVLSIIRPRAYEPEFNDRWTRTGFPITYLVLFVSGVFAAYTGWNYRGQAGDFGIALGVIVIMAVLGSFYYRYRISGSYRDLNVWARTIANRTTDLFDGLIGLSWGGAALRPVYWFLSHAQGLLSRTLENEGGLLWEILLLIAIVILIASRAGVWN